MTCLVIRSLERSKINNGTRVILISAYDLDYELVKELEENKYITKFIEKPIQLHNLIELVANTIN